MNHAPHYLTSILAAHYLLPLIAKAIVQLHNFLTMILMSRQEKLFVYYFHAFCEYFKKLHDSTIKIIYLVIFSD